ncbi:MAG: choice-of-anchor D domain-containing protein, partial [Ignavibacteriaceae bacterium]|nr:choice-of-anchor D domain-containing protein [Ignavibacteriaceae bacterium]
MFKNIFKFVTTVFLLAIFAYSQNSFGQLSGTYTIPGTPFATIKAAVDSLNLVGVGTGGVTFNVTAGYTESITAPITITATGSAGNAIVFQKSGAGANPLVTRTDVGTIATSAIGADGDAVFRMNGTDYITFNGIDVTATDQGIEYGYYTFKPSGTDGCQFVTITNCVVTMTKGTSGYVIGINISNGPLSSSSATGVVVTGASGMNSNVTITGNTVQNVHAGVYVRGATAYYDSSITIGQSGAGNIITNFGGGNASSTYGVYFIYVENPSVAYNTITSATHGATLYGIFYSSVSGDVVGSNNAFTMANNAASSATYYIYNANTVTTANYNNNTFAAGTLSSTGTVYLIYASSGTPIVNVSGNQTSGSITRTGASGSFYCYYNLGSPASGTETLSNNNFSNISVTGSSLLYGIYSNTATGQNRVSYNNTISNWTGGTGSCYAIYHLSTTSNTIYNNSIHDITTGGTFYGLYFTGTNPTVYGNNVYNITTTGTTLYGIYDAGTGTTNCYKNQVYNLTANNATATLYGFYISTGTSNYVYNNFVSDLKTPILNSTTLTGMYISGGTFIGLYYNTIYLNATSSGTNFGSNGIYASTTPTVDLRNNVVVNASTPNGTGFSIAYRRSTTTLTTYAAASNNNCFYAGTPSASNLIFYDGTNSDQTLAAYKTRVSPRDAASVSENPPFVNVTTAPYDLHINTAVATQLESGGTPVSTPVAITDDFDGNARNATTPDIGGDEFAGTPQDLTPPSISYSLISNQSYLLTSVSLTATITDFSGVAGGSNSPRLYIKKINDVSYVFDNNPTIVGDDYTFTIPYSAIGGVAIGDTIVYYVAAQDVPGNAGTNPAGGSGSNPPGTTPPPVPNAYLIVDIPLSGTYTVGISSFEMLTGKKLTFETRTRTVTRDMNGVDAYEDINSNINEKEKPGVPDYSPRYQTITETYVEILENGKPFDMSFFANNPTLAAYPTITAAIADLKLRGASGPVTFLLVDTLYASETYPIDLTFFGGASSTNTVTIKPAVGVNAVIPGVTGQTTASIWLESGGYYIIDGSNTVGGTTRNLTIQSVGSYPAVHFYSSGNNNVVKNCIIEAQSTSTGSGALILAAGTGSSNNLIDNCLFRPYSGGSRYGIGVYLFSSFLGTNNVISNCEFKDFNDRAITIQGALGADNNDAIGNVIYQTTPSSASSVYGFYLGRALNTDIVGNQVFNLSSVSASPTIYGLYAILASADMTVKLTNNTFSLGGLNAAGTIKGVDYFGYSVNNFEMYYNTVYIAGSGVTAGTTGAVVKRDAVNNWVMVDNVFLNERSNGTGTGFHYGAQFTNTTATTYTMNYNDYYANGAGGLLGIWGTANVDSLLEWQNVTLQDANSINLDPLLVSESDLRPYVNSPVIGAGTPVAGITTDILGVTRSVTTPTMGAYEQGAPLPSVADPTGVSATAISGTQIDVAFTPNGNNNNVVIVYNLTGIFTTPTGTPTVGGTLAGGEVLYIGTTSPYSHTSLTPVTTYYYKLFSYDGSNYSPGVNASATTPCASITTFPWTEGFETVTIPALPNCWYEDPSSGGWVTTNNSNSTYDADARTGAQFLREAYSAIDEFVWTPGFELVAGTSYDFKFWWAGDNYSGWTGDVFYNTSQTSTGATQLGTSFVTSGETTTKTYQQETYQFTPTTNGTYYFAIRVNASSVPWYLSFDDMTFDLTPTVPVFSITPSSKDYGTTLAGNSIAQDFTISNAGVGTLTINAGGITLTGPDPSQFTIGSVTYPINLNAGESTVITVSFTPTSAGVKNATLQIVHNAAGSPATVALTGKALPAGILFEDFTAVNALDRWTVVNLDSGANMWERLTSKFNSSPASAGSYYESSTLQNNDWLISPKLSVVSGDSLMFWHSIQSATYPESLYVKIGTTNDPNTGTWTNLAIILDNTTTWKQKKYSLEPWAGQNIYVAFVNRSLDAWVLYVDDIIGPLVYVPAVDLAFTDFYQSTGLPTPRPGENFTDYKVSLNYESMKNDKKPISVLSNNNAGVHSTIVERITPVSYDGIIPFSPELANIGVKGVINNVGLNSASYNLDWTVGGVNQTQYVGPSVPSNSADTANLSFTSTNIGTFLTTGIITVTADENLSNNDNEFRMRVYPDAFTRTIYDRGDNIVDTYIGWGSATIRMKAGVRFTAPATDIKLAGVDYICRTEAVTNGTWEIQVRDTSSSSGAPGAVLYSKVYSAADYFAGAGDYIFFPFDNSAPVIPAGNEYWITIKAPLGILYPGAAHNNGFTAGHSYYEGSTDTTLWYPLIITTERAWIMRSVEVEAANTFQLSVNILNGWNMVSIPGLHPVDQNVNTWWQYRDPGANVFKYSGGYQVVSLATPGIGYWMKHAGARTYNTGDE